MEVPFNSSLKVCSTLYPMLTFKFMLRIYEADSLATAEKSLSKEEMTRFCSSDSICARNSSLTAVVMFIKGAPDVLFPGCSSVLFPSGEITPLTADLLEDLTVLQSRWSFAGQRVLLLARRIISSSDVDVKSFGSPETTEQILREQTNDLVVVGMIGIVDPPRADIPDVVKTCRRGGIRFFMVCRQSRLH